MLTAIIEAADCIGCSLCVPVCPVDAIVGARKHLHTVLLAECIGCKLCVPACPVDCISMAPLAEVLSSKMEAVEAVKAEEVKIDKLARAKQAKLRFQARSLRLAGRKQQQLQLWSESDSAEAQSSKIRADIQAALARVNVKRITNKTT